MGSHAPLLVDTNGFALGDTVKDTVTGAKGVIIGIHLYLTGCARVSIQPKKGKTDSKVPDVVGSDVMLLEMVRPSTMSSEVVVDRSIGGPRDDPSLPSLPRG